MLGNDSLCGKPLITQLTEMSFVRRIQVIVASSTLIGNVCHQLLLAKKALGTFSALIVPGRVIPDGAEL